MGSVQSIAVDRLAEICRGFGIVECSVFGSAAGGDLARANDVDFLISLREGVALDFDEYAALERELSELCGKPVDVINARFVRNPYLRRSIEQSRRVLYAA
ncbi:MAG: nucleotidyltransferase domain-containing protein [Phycisphaeraceae bacterium]|nr:nucleotidyltransferase domain-containing protein [Phycisphaeraceae bacterium]